MRVLVAFDKFKDSMTARQACAIVRDEILRIDGNAVIDVCPLSDGGEGFCEILTSVLGGVLHEQSVTGPRGQKIRAQFGLVQGQKLPPRIWKTLRHEPCATLAIIEMAQASGLQMLAPQDRDLWQTSSIGTGELLRAARDQGADAILLGVGGSASNDCGLGALAALGLTCHGADGGVIIGYEPKYWGNITQLSAEKMVALPPLRIACDVQNPLTGRHGATATYGPQKGMRRDDVEKLDASVGRIADLMCDAFGRAQASKNTPGAGAAGGIAFGLMTALGAELVSGFDLVASCLSLDSKIAAADIVITGEGRFDAGSLHGKVTGSVVRDALAKNKRTTVFAGNITGEIRVSLATTSAELYSISPSKLPLSEALPTGEKFLRESVHKVFSTLNHTTS